AGTGTAAPLDVTESRVGSTVTASWTAPTTGPDGFAPTGYEACAVPSADLARADEGAGAIILGSIAANCEAGSDAVIAGTALVVVATASPAAITGLTDGTDYAVAVRGTHANGNSDWAAASPTTVTPSDGPPPPPDPNLPTLRISAVKTSYIESLDTSADFTVTVTSAPSSDLQFTVWLTGANDFVLSANRTQSVTITAGSTTATASFPIDDDNIGDATATATATIQGVDPETYNIGSPATATIIDDDSNATLRALTLDPGSLSPRFTSGNPTYIAFGTGDSFTVTPETTISGATYMIAVTAGQATLSGENNNMVMLGADAAGGAGSDGGAAPSNEPVEITITVTATDGTTMMDYTVTVRRGGGANQMAAEMAAPAVGAAIAESVASSIADRIDAVNAGVGGNFNAASLSAAFTRQDAEAMADGASLSDVLGDGVKKLLDGKIHSVALSGDGGVTRGGGMWAGGSYQNLGGDSDEVDWDGDLFSLQVGVDARFPSGTLAGAAVSWSEAEWDYESNDASGAKGEQELRLGGLHPYAAWRVGGGDVWASLGIGQGEFDSTPDGGGAKSSGDVDMTSAAIGGGMAIGSIGHGDLRVKGAATMANMEVDFGMDDELADFDADSRRLRAVLEWSDNVPLTVGDLRRAFELGARHDSGDGHTGTGAEIGAQFTHDNGDGMNATLNARALLAHSGDYDEWGVSGTLRFAPGADGQGLSWRVEPGLGVTQSGVDRLWNESAAELAANEPDESFNPTATMDSEIGYGLRLGEGMLTPYGGMRLSNGTNDYRLGGRYKLPALPLLEMSVEAYRKQYDNSVVFKAGIEW
ncbi:MAG: autotransporter domain-containing protein, partial [bacterium]